MQERVHYGIALRKIMRILQENNSLGRTELAKKANIHYSRMMKQLDLLERYKCTRLEIKNGKVQVTLTKKGKLLAKRLISLDTKHADATI